MNDQNIICVAETDSDFALAEQLPLPSAKTDFDAYLAILRDLRCALEAEEAAEAERQRIETENLLAEMPETALALCELADEFTAEPTFEPDFEQPVQSANGANREAADPAEANANHKPTPAAADSQSIENLAETVEPNQIFDEIQNENEDQAEPNDSAPETAEEAAGESLTAAPEVESEISHAAQRFEVLPPAPQHEDRSANEETVNQIAAPHFETLTAAESDAAPLPADSSSVAEVKEEYAVFRINDQLYAFAAANATEVTEPPEIIELPFVPRWILGAANVNGEIAAVIDLRSMWNLPPNERAEEPTMLLVKSSESNLRACFVTDGLADPVEFSAGELAAAFNVPFAAYARGVTDQNGRGVCLIDVEKFLCFSRSRQF